MYMLIYMCIINVYMYICMYLCSNVVRTTPMYTADTYIAACASGETPVLQVVRVGGDDGELRPQRTLPVISQHFESVSWYKHYITAPRGISGRRVSSLRTIPCAPPLCTLTIRALRFWGGVQGSGFRVQGVGVGV